MSTIFLLLLFSLQPIQCVQQDMKTTQPNNTQDNMTTSKDIKIDTEDSKIEDSKTLQDVKTAQVSKTLQESKTSRKPKPSADSNFSTLSTESTPPKLPTVSKQPTDSKLPTESKLQTESKCMRKFDLTTCYTTGPKVYPKRPKCHPNSVCQKRFNISYVKLDPYTPDLVSKKF